MATLARLREEEELLCLLLLLRQNNKRGWSTRPLRRRRRDDDEENLRPMRGTDKHGETDSNLPEVEGVLEESQMDVTQSTNLRSTSPDLGSICPSALENSVGPVVEQTSPAYSGGKRKASRSVGSGPDVKRRIEDMDLKRLENIGEEKATHKGTESARFGRVVADMLEKIPDHKREAVKFKLYTLLYEALHPNIS